MCTTPPVFLVLILAQTQQGRQQQQQMTDPSTNTTTAATMPATAPILQRIERIIIDGIMVELKVVVQSSNKQTQ